MLPDMGYCAAQQEARNNVFRIAHLYFVKPLYSPPLLHE